MTDNDEEPEIRKKICMLGEAAVGKTSLISRFVFDQFDDKYITTLGTKVSKKTVPIRTENNSGEDVSTNVTIAIWDVIGQQQYHSLVLKYFKNSDGGLVVADGSRFETVKLMRKWIGSFLNTVGKVPILLLINKSDLIEEGKFDKQMLDELCIEFGAKYFFTSAKTGTNVEDAFNTLAQMMVKDSMKEKEISTLVQVADAIIVSFSGHLGGFETAMPIIEQQFKKAGVQFMNPTKEQLVTALKNLVNITEGFQGPEVANQELKKFMEIFNKF
jgi:small GTP-binding protein